MLAGPHELDRLPKRLGDQLGDVLHTAVVPLVQGGDVLAVLVLSRRRDRPFGQEERDTMMVLAGPAALAVRMAETRLLSALMESDSVLIERLTSTS